ncbi:MAG: alpha/beta hydrolase family protein [Rhodopirellula sp.]|nr:alpha/beta hydrolase family protein [Rhodopirellula sp.]
MRLCCSAVLFSVFIAGFALPSQAAEPLQAAVAVADITPPLGYRLSGYYHERLSTAVHDPLLAKAIVFSQGNTQAAMVFCDVIGIPLARSRQARALAEKKTGIAASNILIAATHTHTGPQYHGVLRDYLHDQAVARDGSDRAESVDYGERLVEGIVKAIADAKARIEPVRLQTAVGNQQGLSFNRRFHMKNSSEVRFNPGKLNPDILRPAGPIDPEVGLVLLRSAAGDRPLGSLTTFALHLDTVGGTEYSADFPGYLADSLRAEYGEGFVSLFGNGTCGDINHVDVGHDRPQGGHDEAARIGGELAKTVKAALKNARDVKAPTLAVRMKEIQVPIRKFSDEEAAWSEKVIASGEVHKLPFLDRVKAWNIRVMRSIDGDTMPMIVQVFCLSQDVALVALPGEVFADLGLAIKKASPFATTMVVELAHDAPGYIPTTKAFAEGSYETINGRIQPGGGEMLVDTAVGLLKELSAQESTPAAAAVVKPGDTEVTATFDGRPFTYRVASNAKKADYTILRLSYPSPVQTDLPQNNTVPAEYYLPKNLAAGGPKRPAVICLHILGGNFELVRMMAAALASRGVPAIWIKLPYYGERGPEEGPEVMADKPQLFMEAISQGMQDVRRTVDLLASREEVDPEHIGIAGISLGGIASASAAALEPRLSRAVMILAGGDLRQIIGHARETRELQEVISTLPPEQKAKLDEALAAVEPLSHAAQLRDRAAAGRVLMINATDDRVIPPDCTKKLADALGIADKVVWLEGLGHYTAMAALPRIMTSMVAFFAADLPAGTAAAPAEVPPQTPLEIVVGLLKQVGTVATTEPKPGRCHFVDLAVTVGKDGKKFETTVRFLRGAGNRFLLQATLPEVGQAAMGHGDAPWLASKEKIVFVGTGGDEATAKDPLAYVNSDHLVKARVVAGALAGVVMAPEVLEQFVSITDVSAPGGPKTLALESKEGKKGESRTVRLVVDEKRLAPRSLEFAIDGIEGRVEFRDWQIDTAAAPAMFDPPAGLQVHEVKRDDLYRMFSAMFNFAMENVQ